MTRALVVDDKEENVYYLQALLTGNGFTVDVARHGAEALIKARQHPPNVVISDLLMPVMDGYTLLRYWKADSRLKGIPFIVYTATYTEAEDERLALNLGADAFILKPAEPEDFMRRLRGVQRKIMAAEPVEVKEPKGDAYELLKVYSETLIRKLEEKTIQLEETNKALEKDIAERRAAEERVGEQAALLDQTQDAIMVCDLDHRISYWNKGAERIYGWTASEAMGAHLRERVHRDVSQLAGVMGALQRCGEWSGELRHATKAGAEVILEGRWTMLRDHEGRPRSILAINTDVTERKKIEAQFLRAQRMESIGTLAGGIAHDLNNLLAPIVMAVDLLRLDKLSPDMNGVVDTIEASARRGTDLVKQVLSFARGVEGARVAVHLGHIIREIESIAANTFPKNIRVETEGTRDPWLIQGDPTQLNQVLLNLSVNARDAMPSGGRLRFSVRNREVDGHFAAMNRGVAPGRYVSLEVSDTGCGMKPEVLERIFEPFFTTKEVGRGTGLGLSTVLGIVRSHGGFVNVESELGRGSTFKAYFPAQPDTSFPLSTTVAFPDLPRGRGETVLLVDDESSILTISRQTLESFGYRVLTAEDGAQAMGLYALNREEIDLVLTDVMMPVMDGVVLVNALRRIDPQVKVIAASGFDSKAAAVRMSGMGLDEILAKPYTAEAMLAAVRKSLEQGRQPAGPS